MQIDKLFPLSVLSDCFEDYYADTDMNVYSNKSGTLCPMKGSTSNMHQYWNFSYFGSTRAIRKDELNRMLNNNKLFQEWKSTNSSYDMSAQKSSKGFIIGSVDEHGIMSFSNFAKVYNTEQSTRIECERLANSHINKTFVYAEIKGYVKSSGVTWN